MRFSRGKCLLLYWLKKRNMRQVDLSRKSGYSKRLISFWCNDERKMTPEAMYTIASILDIRMDELYVWQIINE